MSLLWAGLVIVGVSAVTVTTMLLVRRSAPEGSYFEDGDRAAGVFGVIATGFAVLLGFVVFLAFESYDTSRSGAEAEAQVVAQQFQIAQLFPVAARAPLSERARLLRAQRRLPGVAADAVGLGRRPDQPLERHHVPHAPGLSSRRRPRNRRRTGSGSTSRPTAQTGRSDRTHGAEGVIPAPLWIVLFLSAAIIFVFMLFFADSGEHAVVQATMMGGVTVVISSMLLLLWFLDNPYHSGVGGLPPTAMERTLEILDQQAKLVGLGTSRLCDARGVAT